jgi:hypothetical protein
MLVDFELGRLSARRSTAVEQHIRSCETCKRQGLGHAVTEQRRIVRKLDRVRPAKRLFSTRMRGFILVLALVLLFQLVVFEFLQPGSALHQLLDTSPTTTPSPGQTPTALLIKRDVPGAKYVTL